MRGKTTGRYRPDRGANTRGGADGQAWLTTYADAVTLLLAFFVLLFSLAEMDLDKFSQFLAGLRSPFGNEAADGLLPDSDGLEPEVDPGEPEDPIDPDELDELAAALEELEAAGVTDLEEDVLRSAEALAVAEAQLDDVQDDLHDTLDDAGLDELVETHREERGLVISIAADDVLFALGSTEINEAGRDVIRVVGEALGPLTNDIEVEGHTDDVPLERDGYSNWNLSTDRAVAVLTRMIDEHGLDPERAGAVGFGEYRPVADNDTDEGRARNRRVDVVVLTEHRRSQP